MATNPIMPLYYNDIDRSTRDWTDEEFGCYMRLLMHQWDKGEIPKETQRLARIVTSLDKNWDFIRAKFTETETGMYNNRLEEIRSERNSFLKKQSENGKKGGRKPKINPNDNPNDNPNTNPKQSLHIEYENEIEIEIEKEKKKGVQGETYSDKITEHEIGQAKEYVHITGQRILSDDQVCSYWRAYLIHSQGMHHGGRNRQMQHFRNWLKLQPNEKFKGNHQRKFVDTSAPGRPDVPL